MNKYNLIVRPHDLSKVREAAPEIILDKQFSTYDWIRMADAVITDYSSLALETAIAGKPLYFYIRDIEAYKRETGLNICFEQEKIGKYAIKDIGKLMETIKEPYDYSALEDFKKRYMEVSAEHAVDEFVAFIKTAGGFNGTI